jgi:hypothetical protein
LRILIITDAWLPQINGVVRSIETLVKGAPALGVEIKVLAANEFRTLPLPTYPQGLWCKDRKQGIFDGPATLR